MDAIFNFVFEVVLRALGLGVLKILTFGRYKGASSYLYFFPSLVGLVFLIFLSVLALLTIDWLRNMS